MPTSRNHGQHVQQSDTRAHSLALDHATRLIRDVCCLAGSFNLLERFRDEELCTAIRERNSGVAFDRLTLALSFQGIADAVASDYIKRHGRPTLGEIAEKLATAPSCPKLHSFWQFHDCRYEKTKQVCLRPDLTSCCPLPSHRLRNGHLNQLAYSLALFIRDIAAGDLIGWIDRQLAEADRQGAPDRLTRAQKALTEPLRNVYGVSDKVLAMALSGILIGAAEVRPRWREVGVQLIAVDTLVHNFLHRTGILHRFAADHAYGANCYRPGGCAEILRLVADRIDARQFNPEFPAIFPRFVQHAIWRYCSQQGFDICNGNRIDDRRRCENRYCRIYDFCDRISLKSSVNSMT